MLHTKEFHEIMDTFERTAKNYVRFGSQGLKRGPREKWENQQYYLDGNANQAFIIFLAGYSLGKCNYQQ